MAKPLSQKTLDRRYTELGLSKEKQDLLRTYYCCFANLYGAIDLRTAWRIFREYEGVSLIHKKDFIAFSGVVIREPGLPFVIRGLKEVYPEEESEDEADRMIIHERLLGAGAFKYAFLYATLDAAADKPFYMPDKEEFLLNVTNRFYQTEAGKKMDTFIGNLVSDGVRRDWEGNNCGDYIGLDGDPVRGKRLKDVIFLTKDEEFDQEYYSKLEWKKDRLLELAKRPAKEKVLEHIQRMLQVASPIDYSLSQNLLNVSGWLGENFGVRLTEKQLYRFFELAMELINHSTLWSNCGWTPSELSRALPRNGPPVITIGPGMRQMFRDGTLDEEEIRKAIKENGFLIPD